MYSTILSRVAYGVGGACAPKIPPQVHARTGVEFSHITQPSI